MDNLVYIHHEIAVCDSLQVTEKFEKEHRNVMRDITNLLENTEGACSKLSRPLFLKNSYIHPQNKQRYPKYYMTRDGFTLLTMGFTGQKSLEWKLKYINAFNRMESIIREKQTPAWQESRQLGEETRKKETDAIQRLVEYATAQGSSHPGRLYTNYTRLTNQTAGVSSREAATEIQLSVITVAESIIAQTID